MMMETSRHEDGDAVGLLKKEDRAIEEVLRRFCETENSSAVENRSDHGNMGKQLVRRMAVREAAREHIADVLARSELSEISIHLREGCTARREAMNRIENMSRSIQGIHLNAGQDFDGAVETLQAIVTPEIRWELGEAIPLIERTISSSRRSTLFHSARYIRKHAPAKVNPDGPKWYEHDRLVSRVLTVIDHLRDYPRANRGARV
jgi:hypothetical protein